MKLLTYDTGAGPRCGVLQGDHVVDVTALLGSSQTLHCARFEIHFEELIRAFGVIERPAEKQDLVALGRHSDGRVYCGDRARNDPVQPIEATRLRPEAENLPLPLLVEADDDQRAIRQRLRRLRSIENQTRFTP